MHAKEKTSRSKVKRAGIPLTVYLPEEQAADLNEVFKARHVTKATGYPALSRSECQSRLFRYQSERPVLFQVRL